MIVSKTKKWGNSLGIRIPKSIAEELGLKEEQEVVIEIERKENPLKELFGTMKFDKPASRILKELRGKESKHI